MLAPPAQQGHAPHMSTARAPAAAIAMTSPLSPPYSPLASHLFHRRGQNWELRLDRECNATSRTLAPAPRVSPIAQFPSHAVDQDARAEERRKRKKERRRRRRSEARSLAKATRDRRSLEHRPDRLQRCSSSARHYIGSSLHSPRHGITILSPTTPMVSPGPSLLAARPCCFGHGALHRERVGQGRLWPLGTHALTRTSTSMPRPPHRRPVVLLRTSSSPPCRRGRHGAPTGHMGTRSPALSPWTPSPCPHESVEALICPAEPPGSLHA